MRPAPAERCDLFVVHTFTSPHSGSLHIIYKKLPNPEISSWQFDSWSAFLHALQPLSRALANTSNSITRLPRKLQLPASRHFFFVLTPPSPSTLQHFLFQIFFNFSRLPFSFELTKKPFLSLDLVPKPTVAIFKDCVTSVATLCAVEMRNAIQGNDLKSYFSNRLQFVEYNGYVSYRANIMCGVPQGSILGPLFFLLYINDIINTSTILQLILFADDTNVFVSHKDKDCLTNILNAELNKLSIWFRASRLSLNLKKTKFIVFKPCQKRTNQTIELFN